MTLPRPPRRVFAEDVLAGRVNIDAYPFRYMFLTTRTPIQVVPYNRAELDVKVDTVLATVELLETRGWELVNFERLGHIAFMRRAAHPARYPERYDGPGAETNPTTGATSNP
ncbi:hypothetical protein ACNTMW_29310 [Planosporangium sp. 12N6]|uniref:hypothetical protein n=1 Tax=Planosporangium spinosum TaxID=3402278 RepID=UPI003CEC2143